MRALSLVLACCCAATLAAPAAAQLHSAPPTRLAAASPTSGSERDTLRRVQFQVAAQSAAQALTALAQQAGARVLLEVPAAASLQVNAVTGAYTLPEALRLMLDGSGLLPRFGREAVFVVLDPLYATPVYSLRAIEVTAVRNRGYTAVRTSSATKTDTPLRDTPQSISVVTRDVIADQSMQSMADVVRFVPGVTMGQGEGHRDAPTIRGNSTTADFFVDGVRDDAQYLRDLYNVERVEALKGSNAMVFGRGGGGGVMNRVMKEASMAPGRQMTVSGGSWTHRRGTLDISQPLSDEGAVRLNGLFEDSRTFRDESFIRRYAVNPTLLYNVGSTTLRASLEYFNDERTVDRGIPSFEGRPSETGRGTFFGNADASFATADVRNAGLLVEHRVAGLTLRNRSRITDYDKFYQNSYPSSARTESGMVSLGAYNMATQRRNVFNQLDVIGEARTGMLAHRLLVGAELGRQRTDNFRETGYYNNTSTTLVVPFDQPRVATPITFRQSASDADNRSVATVSAVYVQDQVQIGSKLQAVAGLRSERFEIDFADRRRDTELSRRDHVISPRGGLILKPIETASLYGSYSVSYLPSSGDQFASVTATTKTLEPEQFTNLELGGKWDANAALSLTLAAYQLDRTNTSAPDPADATRVVQTGSQRTRGIEASVAGDVMRNWHVVAAAALQDAEITSTTSAAKEGQKVALVPGWTLSLWNRYNMRPALGVGFGVVRQDEMFAAIDNTVELPGFTRVDGAVFLRLSRMFSAQVNVENMLDTEYFATSHGNNNIMPGAGRTLRVSLTTRR